MGDVVAFRKWRLTGFIPADLGRQATERRTAAQHERDRLIDLIGFAKQGAPPLQPDD
jgi:hypothetical protein